MCQFLVRLPQIQVKQPNRFHCSTELHYKKDRLRLKRDGTRAETRFRLSPKRTSPFKSARASVQSTASSRGVRISVSNAGYTTFRGSVRVLAAHSIRQFLVYFPSRASPCAIRFQTHSTNRQVTRSVTGYSKFLALCEHFLKKNAYK